jgi:drug/metabolite transporter (DMT)-like permease
VQTFLLAFLAAALYGTGLVTTYFGLRHLPALAGARVSIPTAALLFWALSPAFMDWSGWRLDAVMFFALVGSFYPAAVTLLTFVGNRRLGPTVAGTIGSTTPLFAVLGAALLLGEVPGIRESLATAVIVLGTMALSKPAPGAVPAAGRSALWMPWSAALLRALAQVLSKAGLALWTSPFAAALVGYSISAVIVWTAGILTGRGAAPAFTRRGVAWFALTGVLNGAAVLAMFHALTTGPVTIVAPVVATYPLFTLSLSALFIRHERVTARIVGGVILTVGGVIMLVAR